MALSDTIGHPLEVFASKSSTEAKKNDFTSAHPGALSFTTDGRIVFGGEEYGGNNTDAIGIGPYLKSEAQKTYGPIGLDGLSNLLSSICGDAQKLRMFVGDYPSLGAVITVPESTLGNALTKIIYDYKERISTVTENAAQKLKIHGDLQTDGSTSLDHFWSVLGLNVTHTGTTLSNVFRSLGTYLSRIPIENVIGTPQTTTEYVTGVDSNGTEKKLSSILVEMRSPRELEFPYNPAIYMPYTASLLGSQVLYEGMWLGSLLDEMCREILARKKG